MEQLRDMRTRKHSGNKRRRVQTKHDHSVSERCRIGQENANDIAHSVVSNPVEDLSCCIRFDILADGHQDQPESAQGSHEHKPLHSSPNIEDFRNWEF